MQTLNSKKKAGKFLTFFLGEEEYGLEILKETLQKTKHDNPVILMAGGLGKRLSLYRSLFDLRRETDQFGRATVQSLLVRSGQFG